jgi:hypothetical protein
VGKLNISHDMILRIVTIILAVQIILSTILFYIMKLDLLSFGLGGFISAFNFAVLAFLWGLIIYKKRVAPSVIVVVIKYGILIYLFMKIPQISWIKQNDLVYGILVNPAAVVLGGFFLRNKSEKS